MILDANRWRYVVWSLMILINDTFRRGSVHPRKQRTPAVVRGQARLPAAAANRPGDQAASPRHIRTPGFPCKDHHAYLLFD